MTFCGPTGLLSSPKCNWAWDSLLALCYSFFLVYLERNASSAIHTQNSFHLLMSLSENLHSVCEDPPTPSFSLIVQYIGRWFVGSTYWVVCAHFHSTLTLLLYITRDRCSDLTVWPRMSHLTILTTSWNAARVDNVKTLLMLAGVWITIVMLAMWGRTRADAGIFNLWVPHNSAVVTPSEELTRPSHIIPEALGHLHLLLHCQNPCPMPFPHSLDSSGLKTEQVARLSFQLSVRV